MKNKAKHFYGRVALVVCAACVAVTSAAAVGQSAGRQEPSDPGATVAPLRYESFLPAKTRAARDVSPADSWKEANRTVASFDAMSLTMTPPDDAGAIEADQPAPAAATQADPHAGHKMTATPASDPHAAHQMPAQDTAPVPMKSAARPTDPHAGHKMPNKPVAANASQAQPAAAMRDPHAGHGMPPAAPDPHAGHAMPPARQDPHAGHAMEKK